MPIEGYIIYYLIIYHYNKIYYNSNLDLVNED